MDNHSPFDAAQSLSDDLAESATRIIRNTDFKDVPGLVGEAESYARRNPLAFAALAVGIGFLAARTAKASAFRRDQTDHEAAVRRRNVSHATGRTYPTRSADDFGNRHIDRSVPDVAASYPPNPGL